MPSYTGRIPLCSRSHCRHGRCRGRARQCYAHSGVSPRTARTLLCLGQSELLIQAARERGDWNCAQAPARELCPAAEFERARALLIPLTDVGWRAAEWTTAEIVIQQGEGDEALAMVGLAAAERDEANLPGHSTSSR
ncbi:MULTISPECIES: hypothetical protein [unclassified Streptomyces]|uniref:hypothetical protein n=1 Tax=unclassified Streptomyces TaxID=2593676 RepID=UPI0011CE112A|nr:MULTISPECIES: hypothetical protein [unclassified Streptomyces]TXS71503.1 hypothetical protein EAO69_22165 [Streptomyces sp. me109]